MYLRNMNKYLKEYSRYFIPNSRKGLRRISHSIFLFEFKIHFSFDCLSLIVFSIYSFADYSVYTDTHTRTHVQRTQIQMHLARKQLNKRKFKFRHNNNSVC